MEDIKKQIIVIEQTATWSLILDWHFYKTTEVDIACREKTASRFVVDKTIICGQPLFSESQKKVFNETLEYCEKRLPEYRLLIALIESELRSRCLQIDDILEQKKEKKPNRRSHCLIDNMPAPLQEKVIRMFINNEYPSDFKGNMIGKPKYKDISQYCSQLGYPISMQAIQRLASRMGV